MALKLRRGLEADRASITPAEGEPLYTTDGKKLYIGDGATAGGVSVGGGYELPTLATDGLVYFDGSDLANSEALQFDGTALRLAKAGAIDTYIELATFQTPAGVAGARPQIKFGVDGNQYNQAELTFAYYGDEDLDNALVLGTQEKLIMFLNSRGRVGIGVEVPTAQLHIAKEDEAQLCLEYGTGGTRKAEFTVYDDGTFDIAASDQITISSDGNGVNINEAVLTNNLQTAAIGVGIAPNATTDGLKLIKSTAVNYDGLDVAITTTGTGTVSPYAIDAVLNVEAAGTVNNGRVIRAQLSGKSETTLGVDFFAIGGSVTQPAGGLSGTNGQIGALASDTSNQGTITNATGARLRIFNSGATATTTTARGLDVRFFNLTSGASTTNFRGLSFEGWNASGAGTTLTNNYLIYADTSTATGTNRHTLYLLPDMPAYHVGRFGIGTGVTAPTARLQVRHATDDQLRLEYDATNFLNVRVNADGRALLNAKSGGDFVFNGPVTVPYAEYDSGEWFESLEVPTKQAIWEAFNGARYAAISFIIDGGGSAITTGIKGDLEIPFNCSIQWVTLLADQSGSIVVDIWRDTYANYPPTVADTITASAKPTLSSAVKSQNSTLTGWSKAITANDILRFNVDSAATVQRVLVSLIVLKN
jgi:hypothetical protein